MGSVLSLLSFSDNPPICYGCNKKVKPSELVKCSGYLPLTKKMKKKGLTAPDPCDMQYCKSCLKGLYFVCCICRQIVNDEKKELKDHVVDVVSSM